MMLTPVSERDLERADLEEAFAHFLRLNVAQGDASPHTIRSYHSNVAQFVSWCEGEGIEPASAGEDDLIRYRAHLIERGYARGTISVKLSAIPPPLSGSGMPWDANRQSCRGTRE